MNYNKQFYRYLSNYRILPLHNLAERGNNIKLFCQFLRQGENPNLKSDLGDTPLHIAALNAEENEAIIIALITAGADVNAENNTKNTPLDFAIIHRKHKMIEILLRAGADVNHKDRDSYTPLHFTIKNCILFRRMNSRFICTESNKYVDLWIVEQLLQHGANVDARDHFYQTPLWLAVEVGNPTLVRMLLSKGASADLRERRFGNTPLHIALGKRKINLAIVSDLLKHGASVDMKNIDSQTCWQLAIQNYFSSPTWEYRNARIFIKTFVLFTTEYRTFQMPRATPGVRELYRFYQKCTFEAEVLKTDFITSKCSVYDFLFNDINDDYLDDSFSVKRASDYVFRNLQKGIYAVYFNEILNGIGRLHLTEEFLRCKVFANTGRHKVYLHSYHLHIISLNLSLLDMFNFILAFTKHIWFKRRLGLLQRCALRVLNTCAPRYMRPNFVLRH